jgi:AP2 domain/HNH endonuclease
LRGPFSFCETAVKRRPRLTRARLRELLRYNPRTGEFRWRKRFCNRLRVGDLAGSVNRRGYRLINLRGRTYSEHQLAWFYMKGRWGRPTIDHRDGNVTNNRWNNLRRATWSENNANRCRSRNNTSGYKGVFRCRKTGKWRACICKNGQTIHLGAFTTPQAAHAAYVAAARKLFGEFARAE